MQISARGVMIACWQGLFEQKDSICQLAQGLWGHGGMGAWGDGEIMGRHSIAKPKMGTENWSYNNCIQDGGYGEMSFKEKRDLLTRKEEA